MADEPTVQPEDDEPQDQLDPQTRARREAALRFVRKYGDPVLRTRARPVESFDADRPVNVRVRALNERGEPLVVEASGLEARVIQHEMDHLDGVLILDRTTREQRKEAMRALREAAAAPLGASV